MGVDVIGVAEDVGGGGAIVRGDDDDFLRMDVEQVLIEVLDAVLIEMGIGFVEEEELGGGLEGADEGCFFAKTLGGLMKRKILNRGEVEVGDEGVVEGVLIEGGPKLKIFEYGEGRIEPIVLGENGYGGMGWSELASLEGL